MLISIDDVQTMRAVLDRTPTNLREDRAIKNIFHALSDAIVRPLSEPTPTKALEKFDALTGPEKLRNMEFAFGYCREDSIEKFSIEQLMQIRRMWLASPWDIAPDKWTDRQIADALAGKAPNWDRNEKPVYE